MKAGGESLEQGVGIGYRRKGWCPGPALGFRLPSDPGPTCHGNDGTHKHGCSPLAGLPEEEGRDHQQPHDLHLPDDAGAGAADALDHQVVDDVVHDGNDAPSEQDARHSLLVALPVLQEVVPLQSQQESPGLRKADETGGEGRSGQEPRACHRQGGGGGGGGTGGEGRRGKMGRGRWGGRGGGTGGEDGKGGQVGRGGAVGEREEDMGRRRGGGR